MNEFIAWDKKSGSFRQIIKIDFVNMYFQLESKSGDDYKVNLNDLTTHTYIGITDIDGNKIYADSSIVEFEFRRNHPLEIWDKFIGTFRFNDDTLHYWIDCLNGYEIGYGSNTKNIKNLKVIGNLQQDKHLLDNN